MGIYVKPAADAALRRAMEGGYDQPGVYAESAILAPYYAARVGIGFESMIVAPAVSPNDLGVKTNAGDTLRYTATLASLTGGYEEQSSVVVDTGAGETGLQPVAGEPEAPSQDIGFEDLLAAAPAQIVDPGSDAPVPLAEMPPAELALQGYYYLVQAPDGQYYDVPYESL